MISPTPKTQSWPQLACMLGLSATMIHIYSVWSFSHLATHNSSISSHCTYGQWFPDLKSLMTQADTPTWGSFTQMSCTLYAIVQISSSWFDWMGLKKTNLQKCPPCGNECQNTCKKIANSEWLKMEDCKHWYWANEKHGFQQSKHELEIRTELVPSHWNYLHSNQTKFHFRSWQHFHSTSHGYQSKDAWILWTKREKHKHPSSNQNFSILPLDIIHMFGHRRHKEEKKGKITKEGHEDL